MSHLLFYHLKSFFFYILYILHSIFKGMTKPDDLERSWNCALLAQVLIPSDCLFPKPAMTSFHELEETVGGRWWFFFIADPFIDFTWSHPSHCHPAEKMIISSHNRICVNPQQWILNSKDALPHLWSCCHSSWVLNNSCRKVDVTCKFTKWMPVPVNNSSQKDWLLNVIFLHLTFTFLYIQWSA